MSEQKAAFESKLEGGDQRAAFEAWCQERFGRTPLWDHENNKYLLSSAQMRFEAYQAAIEADRQARGKPVEPANPVLHAQIQTLRKYQAWRTGEDERTMDEAGIVPSAITSALDAVLGFAEARLLDAMSMTDQDGR